MPTRPKRVTSRRAEPVRIPLPSADLAQSHLEARQTLRAAESIERRRMVAALLLLAIVILLAGMVHAGWGRVFVPGWWRLW